MNKKVLNKSMKFISGMLITTLFTILLLVVARGADKAGIIPYSPKVQVAYAQSGLSENDLMRKINAWRVQTNKDPYVSNELVCRMASKRINEVSQNFSHEGFTDLLDLCAAGDCYIAENLAYAMNSNDEVLTAWLESPAHRANLEADYKYSCIRIEGNTVVHNFLTI